MRALLFGQELVKSRGVCTRYISLSIDSDGVGSSSPWLSRRELYHYITSTITGGELQTSAPENSHKCRLYTRRKIRAVLLLLCRVPSPNAFPIRSLVIIV